MRTKAYINNTRITKYEIGVLIEKLPGNIPWGTCSMMTKFVDSYTLEELAITYNKLITDRKLTHRFYFIEIIKEG